MIKRKLLIDNDEKFSNTKIKVGEDQISLGKTSDVNFKYSLQNLPEEVLQLIFQYLDPKSVLILQQLKCDRINEALEPIRFADFSSWNEVSPSDINLYFTSNRVRYIRKINFNYTFLLLPSTFEKVIIKCKHLTTLSVIRCGLTFENIKRIFHHCEHLTELHWNGKLQDLFNIQNWISFAHQISVLYLFFDDRSSYPYNVINSKLETFLVNFSSCNSMCLNFAAHTANRYPLKASERSAVYTMYTKTPVKAFWILNEWEHEWDFPLKNVPTVMVKFNCYPPESSKDSSFTSIKIGEDFSLVNQDVDQKPHAKVINMMDIDMKFLCMVLEEAVANCTFFMAKGLHIIEMKDANLQNGDETRYQTPDVFDTIVPRCYHIRELILTRVHFTKPLDFISLPFLKGLEILKLTSCFFITSDDQTVNSRRFEEVVTHCPNIQEFSLVGCAVCDKGPKDKDLDYLLQWKKLCYLSLVNVKNIQFCSFVRSLPENCPNLKSLELLKIGVSCLCHYIPNVIHVLNRLPNLIHLSMNMDSVHSNSEKFWSAVSACKNLQSLCLIMISLARITIFKPIVDAVKLLKYLHVFHLYILNPPTNLCKNIKRAMNRNGIKYARVEIWSNRVQTVYCEKHHLMPKIISPPEDVSNSTGGNVALSCEAMGWPIPSIEWRVDRGRGDTVPLPSDDPKVGVQTRGGPSKYEITSWLQLLNVQPEDDAVYWCIAKNDEGESSAAAKLIILDSKVEVEKDDVNNDL